MTPKHEEIQEDLPSTADLLAGLLLAQGVKSRNIGIWSRLIFSVAIVSCFIGIIILIYLKAKGYNISSIKNSEIYLFMFGVVLSLLWIASELFIECRAALKSWRPHLLRVDDPVGDDGNFVRQLSKYCSKQIAKRRRAVKRFMDNTEFYLKNISLCMIFVSISTLLFPNSKDLFAIDGSLAAVPIFVLLTILVIFVRYGLINRLMQLDGALLEAEMIDAERVTEAGRTS
jgi:hypothetical protein